MLYLVMGVSGSGKTTIGQRLASRLGLPFHDADDFHPPENRHKMHVLRQPLTDEDRRPWLARLADAIRAWEADGGAVLACSALKGNYRDQLLEGVPSRVLFLHGPRSVLEERLRQRSGHPFPAELLQSQLDALELPEPLDPSAAAVHLDIPPLPLGEGRGEGSDPSARALYLDITQSVESLVEVILAAIPADAGGAAAPAKRDGSHLPDRPVDAIGGIDARLEADDWQPWLDQLAEKMLRGSRRVLLVPPDGTRPESRAGQIVAHLWRHWGHRIHFDILPALGTHVPMTPTEQERCFGPGIPAERVLTHDHENHLAELGVLDEASVSRSSDGLYRHEIPIAAARHLFDGYDLVLSIGQVVPHEVAGMANYTKNIVIGLGGKGIIDHSHFLGALYGIERTMGEIDTPVRRILNAAFERFIRPRLRVAFLLSVVESSASETVLRGLFFGEGEEVFQAAARLSQSVNRYVLLEPLTTCVVSLAPEHYHSTWLGNKAIYRTRRAMADGGRLIILAPGVTRFGESAKADALIRGFGYRGTEATLAALERSPELRGNLSIAAHLIHGSTEGRFSVDYATGAGLSANALMAAGLGHAPIAEMVSRYAPSRPALGWHTTKDGERYYFIPDPGLGLWMAGDSVTPPTDGSSAS